MAREEKRSEVPDVQRQRRLKNLVLGCALAGFVVLIYLVAIVRMGG